MTSGELVTSSHDSAGNTPWKEMADSVIKDSAEEKSPKSPEIIELEKKLQRARSVLDSARLSLEDVKRLYNENESFIVKILYLKRETIDMWEDRISEICKQIEQYEDELRQKNDGQPELMS